MSFWSLKITYRGWMGLYVTLLYGALTYTLELWFILHCEVHLHLHPDPDPLRQAYDMMTTMMLPLNLLMIPWYFFGGYTTFGPPEKPPTPEEASSHYQI